MNEVLTAIGVIVGVAAITIARDIRDGKSVFRKNGNDLHGTMKELKEHYNDETTKLLSEIRDGIKDLNQRHENYELIGIKTRDCAKNGS